MLLGRRFQEENYTFTYGAVTLYRPTFQKVWLVCSFVTSRSSSRSLQIFPTTPWPQRLLSLTWSRFRLIPVRSPLLGESQLISIPQGTKMFQFPLVRHVIPMYSVCIYCYNTVRVSSFGDLRFKACLAAHRSFSQLSTSFFAVRRQGIRHAPLVTYLCHFPKITLEIWFKHSKECFQLNVIQHSLFHLFYCQISVTWIQVKKIEMINLWKPNSKRNNVYGR